MGERMQKVIGCSLCIVLAGMIGCPTSTGVPPSSDGLIFLEPEVYNSIPLATALSSGVLPASADLSPDLPPAGDQGGSASCVGWAIGYGLKSYQERMQRHWSLDTAEHLFSPSFIYNQAKAGSGCQSGARLIDALNILSEKGCCPLSEMPFDDTICDIAPTTEQAREARNYRISSWRRINQLDPSEVKSHLAAGMPIVIALRLYTSFYGLSGAGRNAIYDAPGGEQIGGHAALAVGYDDSVRLYKVLNSFGGAWGDHGYFYVRYDAWPVLVREAYVAQNGAAEGSAASEEPVSFVTAFGPETGLRVEIENDTESTAEVTISYRDGTNAVRSYQALLAPGESRERMLECPVSAIRMGDLGSPQASGARVALAEGPLASLAGTPTKAVEPSVILLSSVNYVCNDRLRFVLKKSASSPSGVDSFVCITTE